MKNPAANKFAGVLTFSEMKYPVTLSIEISTEIIKATSMMAIIIIFHNLKFLRFSSVLDFIWLQTNSPLNKFSHVANRDWVVSAQSKPL